MLPPQGLLTCSEPPSLPTAFGPHPCRPSPSTSISPFVFEAACSTRPSSPPSDFCTVHAERGGATRLRCPWGWVGGLGEAGGTCSQQHVHGGMARGLSALQKSGSALRGSSMLGHHRQTGAHPSALCPSPVCVAALGRGLAGCPGVTAPSVAVPLGCPWGRELPTMKALMVLGLPWPPAPQGAVDRAGSPDAARRRGRALTRSPLSSPLAAASPRGATGGMTPTAAPSLRSPAPSPRGPPLPCR